MSTPRGSQRAADSAVSSPVDGADVRSRGRLIHPTVALRAVKALHTVIWALFASCIVAIPVVAWREQLGLALVLTAIVAVEVAVLVVNGMRCPLTAVARRYTDDHSDNFDIYLPRWLARYNKLLFGSLYLIGVLLTVARWQGWLP